jgi:glycosyltransferase involved in cell wall biosynthesis
MPSDYRTEPAVSIIMPVRNERDHIRAAVGSALDQDIDVPFEVIVADGASDDGTRQILDEWATREPRLRIVDNPAGATAHGLNCALAAVRAPYFVRVDGHSVARPDYVRRLLELLRDGRCEAAGGIVRAVGASRFGRAVAAVHASRFAVGDAKQHYAQRAVYVDHVAHGGYITELAREIGGFDESFVRNQDYEFDYRYHLAGGRILLEPSIVFDWRVRETPVALARQYFQYGYWKVRALQRHPSSLNLRWLVPPAFVATTLAGVIGIATTPGRVVLGASVGSYAALVALGGIVTSAPIGRRYAPLTALALATIHVSWGSGFLVSAVEQAVNEAARPLGSWLPRLRAALRSRS